MKITNKQVEQLARDIKAEVLERFETKLIFGSCAKFQTGSDIDVFFFGKQIVNKDIIS